MPNNKYSINNEDFTYDSLDEAVNDLWENNDFKVGDSSEVFEGEAVEFKASKFVPSMSDLLQGAAYDEVSEHSESWKFSTDDYFTLQHAVEQAVDKWAEERDMKPKFSELKT